MTLPSILDQILEDLRASETEAQRAEGFRQGWRLALSWATAQIEDEFSEDVPPGIRQVHAWLRKAAATSPEDRPEL